MPRAGFVIDSLLPSWDHPRSLLAGRPSDSPVGVMRFGWIREELQRRGSGLRLELYRPWRRYDAVVFMKSMGSACHALLRRFRERGVRTAFDANVDYLTPARGTFYYDGMAPTEQQREEALAMTRDCDMVIADSLHIASRSREVNVHTRWIPDNVDLRLLPPVCRDDGGAERPFLLWSGASCKLFDLLSIEPVLRKHAGRFTLRVVTDGFGGMERIFPPYRDRLRALLRDLDCSAEPFRDIRSLLSVYAEGGVLISPRFLDNTYNLGHTEWKITLAMACGRLALAAPVPSYEKVHERAEGQGIRVCRTLEDWDREIDAVAAGRVDWRREARAARQVVSRHYSTDVVAGQVEDLLQGMIAGEEPA